MSEQHGGSPGDQFGSIWGNTKTKVSLFQVTMTCSWLIDQIYNLHCCYFWSLNINFMSHQRERYLKSNLTISQSYNLTMSLRRTVRATRAAPPSPAGHHQDHDVHDLQDLYHLDHDQKHSSGQFLTHLVQTEDRRRVQPRPLLWQLQDPPPWHHVQVRSVENILIIIISIIISISVVNKSVVV